MKNNIIQNEFEFYEKCALILCVEHEFVYKFAKRTRWNHRNPGNGRFPTRGTIKWFSSTCIYLSFHTPLVCKYFKSPDDCIEWLEAHVARKGQ